jgi:hypothetical protein
MITVNGRYPGITAPALHSNNMLSDTQHVTKDTITLRLDDRSNLAFWMEIGFDRSDLEDMLRKMDEADEE